MEVAACDALLDSARFNELTDASPRAARAAAVARLRQQSNGLPADDLAALFERARARLQSLGADADEIEHCIATADASDNGTGADADASPLRYPLVTLADFEARPVAPDLIAGMLALDSLAVLVGPPAAGKSALALLLAAAVACARPFLGRETREGFAVYILAEGQGRFSRRTRALRTLHPELAAHALHERFRLVVQPVPLTEPDAVREVLRSIVTLPVPPKLIVIDTLSRCFGLQRDENKQIDMNAFVTGCDALRRATGACVLVLHHTGVVAERPRGSTVLGGAADVVLMVSADGLHLTVVDEKSKDGAGSGGIACRLEVVATPEPDEPDAKGVAVVADQSAAGAHAQPSVISDLPASQRWVLRTLDRVPFNGIDGTSEPELRDAPDLPGARRPKDPSTIRKALNFLVEKQLVERLGHRHAYRYHLTAAGAELLPTGNASSDLD